MKKINLWIESQFNQYKRLWRIMKKPSMTEFKLISKVSGIGVLLLGLIGFSINILINFIKNF